MPSGPASSPRNDIARIAATAPSSLSTFLLTSERGADAITASTPVRYDTFSFVGRRAVEVYAQLRAKLPGIAIVQVAHVTGPEAVDYAVVVAATWIPAA